jgi:hypothetical protein
MTKTATPEIIDQDRRTATMGVAAVGAASLLPSNPASAAVGEATRPFRFEASEEQLADLRRRINATKWPEREQVADASQGVQLATVQKLARYWATEHDWRRVEARLNTFPQFITQIDGLDIHFIHVRSKYEKALPMIVTHGWPGSVIEQLKIIDPLTNPHGPRRKCVGRLPSRDSIATGLRFLRQADRARLESASHRSSVGDANAASRLRAVRGAGRRLG